MHLQDPSAYTYPESDQSILPQSYSFHVHFNIIPHRRLDLPSGFPQVFPT